VLAKGFGRHDQGEPGELARDGAFVLSDFADPHAESARDELAAEHAAPAAVLAGQYESCAVLKPGGELEDEPTFQVRDGDGLRMMLVGRQAELVDPRRPGSGGRSTPAAERAHQRERGAALTANSMARVGSEPWRSGHAAGLGRVGQRSVVALVLVGVRLGERGDRLVEGRAGTEVAGDRDAVA
jgi:hypothetical protein